MPNDEQRRKSHQATADSSGGIRSNSPGRRPVYSDIALTASERNQKLRERLIGEGLVRLETFIPELAKQEITRIAEIEGVTQSEAAQALLQYGIQEYQHQQNNATASAPATEQQFSVRNEEARRHTLSANYADTMKFAAAAPASASFRALSVSPKTGATTPAPPAATKQAGAESPIAAFFRRRKET